MSFAFNPNSYGGFTPGGNGAGDPLGAQALLRRRQKGAGGGQDQSAFDDPTGFFFSKLVQQLNNPPMTKGGEAGYGPGDRSPVDPYAVSKKGTVTGVTAPGERPYKTYGGNTWAPWEARPSGYQKPGFGGYAQPPAGNSGNSDLTFAPTGTMAPAPDFSQLIDLSNQAFGGEAPRGEFGALLGKLQKDIASGQYASGTFESQAGAAAGGAAGAALMNRLKAILAPQLIKAAQTPQGFNYSLNLGGKPLTGGPMSTGPGTNENYVGGFKQQTVLQSMAARGGTQLKTNTQQGGYLYAR